MEYLCSVNPGVVLWLAGLGAEGNTYVSLGAMVDERPMWNFWSFLRLFVLCLLCTDHLLWCPLALGL